MRDCKHGCAGFDIALKIGIGSKFRSDFAYAEEIGKCRVETQCLKDVSIEFTEIGAISSSDRFGKNVGSSGSHQLH